MPTSSGDALRISVGPRSTQVGLSPGPIVEIVPDNCRGAPAAKVERESQRVRHRVQEMKG
jgi:hypothetical protein